MLNAPYKKSKLLTVKHYIASDLEKNFSKYIYISKAREDIEVLREYGEVDVY